MDNKDERTTLTELTMTLKVSRRGVLVGGLLPFFSRFSLPVASQPEFEAEIRVPAADWVTHRYDSEGSGNATTISLSARPESPWSISEPNTGQSRANRRISPPVRSNRILCYMTDENIIARGSVDGREMWIQERTESANPEATPAIADQTVVSGGTTVTAWDLFSGEPRWSTDFSGARVSSPIVVDDGIVYTGNSRGFGGGVIALDLSDGDRLWRVSMGGPVTSSIAVSEDSVYAAGDTGTMKRIDEGEVVWEHEFNAETVSSPMVMNSTIILRWYGYPYENFNVGEDEEPRSFITVFDLEDGTILSEEDGVTRTDFAPIYSDDSLIICNSDGDIEEYSVSENSTGWTRELDEITAAPIQVDGSILVGLESGDIIALDPDSGDTEWQRSVLNQAIAGLCAGQDAIYATGIFNSIGGLHYEQSIEARSEIELLLEDLITAGSFGIDPSTAEEELLEASLALLDREYQVAIDHVNEGFDAIEEDIQMVESTKGLIQSTEDSARNIGNRTSFDADPILNTTAEAQAALDNNNPQEANRLAKDAESQLADVKDGFDNAQQEIVDLGDTIRQARNRNVPLGNATTQRTEARFALNETEFESAATKAAQANSILESRIEHVTSYRESRSEADEAFDTAANQDIQIDEAEAKYENANTKFETEDYAGAANEMVAANRASRNTIASAEKANELITEAENFNPLTPFVSGVASSLGSQSNLESAQAAYAEGDYETAIEAAENARSNQTQARLIINGGIMGSLGAGFVVSRYNGIDKLASYLATKSNDEVDSE